MSAKDKAIMLEMAKVWDERADEAELEKRKRRPIAETLAAMQDRRIGNFVSNEI